MAYRMRSRRQHGSKNRIGELREAIMHPQAILPRRDEPCAPQVGEVPRRHGLWNAKAVVDVTHANLTVDEQAQNPQAGAVGEGLEQGFE